MFVVMKEQVRLKPESLPRKFGSVVGVPLSSYHRDYAEDRETFTHHGVMLIEFAEADALEPLVVSLPNSGVLLRGSVALDYLW